MKYKIGDIVKIKASGEKVKIWEITKLGNYFIDYGLGIGIGTTAYSESELKPYCPSRTGTRDPKTGRFVSKKKGITFHKLDEKARNIIFPETYLDDLVYRPIKGNIANKLDSKQRNYQKILNKLYELEKKIDELGRKI